MEPSHRTQLRDLLVEVDGSVDEGDLEPLKRVLQSLSSMELKDPVRLAGPYAHLVDSVIVVCCKHQITRNGVARFHLRNGASLHGTFSLAIDSPAFSDVYGGGSGLGVLSSVTANYLYKGDESCEEFRSALLPNRGVRASGKILATFG
ncbi:unnamed protein product [Sphagnum balticum]